jgi:hypothetical protein
MGIAGNCARDWGIRVVVCANPSFSCFLLSSFLFVGFVYADVVVGVGGSYACVSIGTPPKEKQAALLVGGF